MKLSHITIGCFLVVVCDKAFLLAAEQNKDLGRKAEYVSAVARGVGLLPWQERGVSEQERAFRESIERRKDKILAKQTEVQHPVMLSQEDFERARQNIIAFEWARQWFSAHKGVADAIVDQSDDYIDRMIPELTPMNPYGATCPNCVGKQSQEAVGRELLSWDYRNPEVCTCTRCGQVYPSAQYPETQKLICPRMGQEFTYYLNAQERAHPDDRSGKYAWHWVKRPIHVSFTGIIRGKKISFMMDAAKSLALMYRLSGKVRYAEQAKRILMRLAHCYRIWLYHDYWDTIADCDPMYAAWHDKDLRLEFKRHLCEEAYKGDTLDKAAMLQSYWGAGRIHPSTDGIGSLGALALAYDLICDAKDESGLPLWSDDGRSKVQRDLLLEYILGAEPFIGGANKATCVNNKAPRIYGAMAAVAKCLGLATMSDTALRGYEGVRDRSFLYDGYSRESPAYTDMYLSELVFVPEILHGFHWPWNFQTRHGVVDLYDTDERLRLMFRAMIDQLRPDGRYPPLSDTLVTDGVSSHLIEIGQKRYLEYYAGTLPGLARGRTPTEYAIFHLNGQQVTQDNGLHLPELYYPAWGTAILRHGDGPNAAMLTLAFSPSGGHRHADNLSLFYTDGGHTMLGDHGYVGDMPVNEWIRSTLSHNVVIVDDAEQVQRGRQPELHRMVISPRVSVVEASSKVYKQCQAYRRLVALMKGPGSQTFVVDIFHVKGGSKHDYRAFSELAASDAVSGRLEFVGLQMPTEKPLPQIGASLKREDIFGLRDVRCVDDPPTGWQAIWRQADRQYRLWMLSDANRVEASNGPGQETREQIGRRVRYVDAIQQGSDLDSTFVAVHEPGGVDGHMPIRRAVLLEVPAEAGPDAVALRIESDWGTYLVLSDFADVAEVAGVRFQGAFGIWCQSPQGKRWLLASGASTFVTSGFGFEGATPSWSGSVVKQNEHQIIVDTDRPVDWLPLSTQVSSHVLVQSEGHGTGFPVLSIGERSISVQRFPMPEVTAFHLDNVHFMEQ